MDRDDRLPAEVRVEVRVAARVEDVADGVLRVDGVRPRPVVPDPLRPPDAPAGPRPVAAAGRVTPWAGVREPAPPAGRPDVGRPGPDRGAAGLRAVIAIVPLVVLEPCGSRVPRSVRVLPRPPGRTAPPDHGTATAPEPAFAARAPVVS